MAVLILIFLSVIAFAFTSHRLMRAITTPKLRPRTTDFNVLALRLERGYRIFAWGVASFVVFAWLIASLIESAQSI